MSIQAMLAVMLTVAVMQPNPQNLREVKEDEAQRELRLDIRRRGVLVPLLVRRNGDVYLLIDGHRRLAACRSLGIEQVPCVVFEREMSEAEVREVMLVTQLHSQALTPFQVYVGCKNWLELHPGSSAKDLAAAISKSEAAVSMTLSLSRCIKMVQEAAAAGQIRLNDWYALSQLPQDQQEAALMARLRGESVAQAKRAARGSNGVKVAKVKCAMPSGVTVTLAGEGDGLTLGEMIEELTALVKEMKRADEQGLDSKTFACVMRDKARK